MKVIVINEHGVHVGEAVISWNDTVSEEQAATLLWDEYQLPMQVRNNPAMAWALKVTR